MKHFFHIAVILAGWHATHLVAAEEEYPVEIRPVSLAIMSPHLSTNETSSYNYQDQVTLGILIKSKKHPVVDVDHVFSTMDQLNDDTGLSLNTEDKRFGLNPSMNVIGDAALLTFNTPKVPAKGAKEITAIGKIKITLGKKTEAFALTNVSLKMQPLDIQSQEFSIIRVTNIPYFANPSVTVKSVRFRLVGRLTPDVEPITFSDFASNPIRARRSASYSGFDGKKNVTVPAFEMEYLLPKDTQIANIKINVWTEVETLTVPFRFTTGIGL